MWMPVIAAIALQSDYTQPVWRSTPRFDYVPPAVSYHDYPKDALANEAEGVSWLRMEVSDQGEILTCAVRQSAGLPSLDAKACELWRTRSRFRIREGVKLPVIVLAPGPVETH